MFTILRYSEFKCRRDTTFFNFLLQNGSSEKYKQCYDK